MLDDQINNINTKQGFSDSLNFFPFSNQITILPGRYQDCKGVLLRTKARQQTVWPSQSPSTISQSYIDPALGHHKSRQLLLTINIALLYNCLDLSERNGPARQPRAVNRIIYHLVR